MFALLGIFLALGIALGFSFAPEARASKSASRAGIPWEYLVHKWSLDLTTAKSKAELNDELNALGKEGWELISGHVGGPALMIFKRPKMQ
jgi:hypothetical protein